MKINLPQPEEFSNQISYISDEALQLVQRILQFSFRIARPDKKVPFDQLELLPFLMDLAELEFDRRKGHLQHEEKV